MGAEAALGAAQMKNAAQHCCRRLKRSSSVPHAAKKGPSAQRHCPTHSPAPDTFSKVSALVCLLEKVSTDF